MRSGTQYQALFRAALRAGHLVSWITDFAAGTRVWGDEALELFGLSLEGNVGRVGGDADELLAAIHPDDRPLLSKYHRHIQMADDLKAEYRIVRPNGSIRYMSGGGTVTERDADGRPVILVNVMADVTEQVLTRRLAEQRLLYVEREKMRFEALVRASAQVVWSTDPAGIAVDDSPSWRAFTGQTFEEWIGQGWLDAVHPDDRPATIGAWKKAVDASEPYEVEYRLRHVSGEYRWTRACGVPMSDGAGSVIGWVGLNEDISNRKQQELHLRLTLRELSHRTKNLLAVIQSIARRTFDGEGGDAAHEFTKRLAGLARSHDLLVQGDWSGASLAELVHVHLNAFESSGESSMEIEGPDLFITPQAAQSFGLALHELATNSAKYGAMSASGGRISVRWEVTGEPGQESFAFRWIEKPRAAIRQAAKSGFGSLLLTRIVGESVQGRSEYALSQDGITWTLETELTHLAPSSQL
jgi:PAS domain S-box-containing protein